jgi:signal transduction histidine kinase
LELSITQARATIELGDLPTIEADGPQIRHLLQNLVENAVKYRNDNEPPVVKIHWETSGNDGSLLVEDNGIGFEEQYLDRIFKPFQQLHGPGKFEGTGMGLAICRKIVERHGGSITARSEPGQGTTFIVRFSTAQKQGLISG